MLSHFTHVWLSATQWTVACQSHLSMGFSRQEYWSGLPCPPPGDLPDLGIETMSLMSPVLAGRFFTTSATCEALTLVSVQLFNHSVVSDSLRPHELQHTRPPCPSPTPGVYSNSCALSQWHHPAISSCHPLLLLPPIPPSIRVFFQWVNSSHEVAKVLESQLQHQFSVYSSSKGIITLLKG